MLTPPFHLLFAVSMALVLQARETDILFSDILHSAVVLGPRMLLMWREYCR